VRSGMSEPNLQPASSSDAGRYILSISLPLTIICVAPTVLAATCLLTGGSWSKCNFPPPRDDFSGLEIPAIFFIFILIPALPFLWLSYAPLFLFAKMVAKLHPLTRKIYQILYWIFSWAIIGVSPIAPIFAVDVSRHGFAQTKRLFLSEPLLAFMFAAYGAVCGVFYCMFTLRRR
jgi:hypothetical protein